jgi:superfamily I DNA and/or RNA helicase
MRETGYFPVPEKWKGVRWFDVEGEVPSGTSSAYKEGEIRGVLRLLGAWKEEGLLRRKDPSVGVVTPFRAQEERIREKARQQSWWRKLRGDLRTAPATIGTIHQYQGGARDLVIFSPVVAPAMKRYTERWVATTEQLLDVEITRARASLLVVSP